MENFLIWGFVLPALVFGVLIALLVASERELKKKSRRLAEVESQLGNVPKAEVATRQEEKRFPEMEGQVARLSEENTRLQEQITGLKKVLEATREKLEKLQESQTPHSSIGSALASLGIGKEQPAPPIAERAASPETHPARSNTKGIEVRRRLYQAAFASVLVLVLGGMLTVWSWHDRGTEIPGKQEEPSPTEEVDGSAEQVKSAVSESLPVTPVTSRAQSRSPKNKQGIGKAAQPLRGEYEVVQSATVYNEPSEEARAIADIDPGVKVNVVDAKGDWLEIRSKYGRPPGFIKKESAVPTRNR